MDESQFWQIIESAKGNDEEVTRRLKKLAPEEIDAWDALYWAKHNTLHRWDVWGAAYVINGGCGQDSFHYFKAFAIGKGRAFYEALKADPDSIGGMISFEDLDEGFCDNEALNCASAIAYEEFSEEELELRSVEDEMPAGDPFEEDEDHLKGRFPRLWARFANR